MANPAGSLILSELCWHCMLFHYLWNTLRTLHCCSCIEFNSCLPD
ncbi:unnamed protein product [Prunus brigantina]